MRRRIDDGDATRRNRGDRGEERGGECRLLVFRCGGGSEQEQRGQRAQKREVQDGQASGMRGEFVHQAAFARLALL